MLSRTFATPSIISLATPFTRASLTKIRDTLVQAANQDSPSPDPTERHAAVLVPLCNVNDTPGVLLEVRGKLRMHSGEVSFPGGRADETDPSFLAAALRETHEEVGVLPAQVEILGQFGPAEISLGGLRVWPYVGFVHPHRASKDTQTGLDASDDTPLPSISLASLTVARPEVATVFHLPLSAVVAQARLQTRLFKDDRPYWAIDVSDLVPPGDLPWTSTDARGPSQNNDGRVEVWGLTGWYLSLLLKVFRVYQ